MPKCPRGHVASECSDFYTRALLMDRIQIDKALSHRHVGRVQCEHLFAALDLPIAQQLWPALVSQTFAAQVRLAIQRFDSHFAYQCTNMLASDHDALSLKQASALTFAHRQMDAQGAAMPISKPSDSTYRRSRFPGPPFPSQASPS